MSEALDYFYYLFDRLVSLIFNDMAIFEGVTVGWIITVCFVFGILLHNILSLPSRAPTTHNSYRATQTISHTESVGGDRITYSARYKM